MIDAAILTPIVLAQGQTPVPDDPGGRGEDFGKSSPVALVLLLLFFIAVALLIASMNRHLRRVPRSFDDQPDQPNRSGQPKPGESGHGGDQPGARGTSDRD